MTAKNDELTHTLFAEQFPQTKRKGTWKFWGISTTSKSPPQNCNRWKILSNLRPSTKRRLWIKGRMRERTRRVSVH